MESTQSQRMNTLREMFHLTDRQLGELLGMSQVAARNIRIGATQLSAAHADSISCHYSVNKSWLLFGEGPIEISYNTEELPAATVSEPVITYGENNLSEINITARFNEQIVKYKGIHHLNLSEFSEKIHCKYNHINKITNGHNQVSMQVLRNAVHWCGFNSNYTLTGKGNLFTKSDTELKEIQEKCQKLEEINNLLRENIELLRKNKRDKKSDKKTK